MSKKIRVTADYDGRQVYKFVKCISPNDALSGAEDFIMKYIPRYTVEEIDEEEEDEKE